MASRDEKRPNIMLVLTDDQGCWAMECAGNNELKTPQLDRLAESGLRFENFFCASPVCSPARATILIGQIPSQHGVHDWIRAGNSTLDRDRGGVLIEYLAGQVGYTDLLAADGYRCGISGKWHLGDSHHPQKGFLYWEVNAGGYTEYYNAPLVNKYGQLYYEPRYVTDVITDNALAFLEEQAANHDPFYLSVHYTAPHSPWSRDQHPVEIYDDYFNNCPFESTPDEPVHPWQINSAPVGSTPEKRRAHLSGYYAAITAMDSNLGRIVDWLETHRLRENTLLIFTSDNGMNMGHHGIWGKGNGTFPQNMFDTSVKVPMLISRPGHVPPGQVRAELLSHYDLLPTLLEYVGLRHPAPENLPGQSFAGLLRGEAASGCERVVVYDEYGPVRMIRTPDWKYVHRYPYGPHELYHLAHDPAEKLNLLENGPSAEYQSKLKELRAELEEWFLCYVNPKLDGRHHAVTGMGQLGLAGSSLNGDENFADNWFYISTKTKKQG
jgi:arylsulfatase A-like enzyme